MKKELTLLEQAKLIKGRKSTKTIIGEQEMEIALAWVKEEITIVQLVKALDLSNQTQAYAFLSKCFRLYVKEKYYTYLKK